MSADKRVFLQCYPFPVVTDEIGFVYEANRYGTILTKYTYHIAASDYH